MSVSLKWFLFGWDTIPAPVTVVVGGRVRHRRQKKEHKPRAILVQKLVRDTLGPSPEMAVEPWWRAEEQDLAEIILAEHL